jgi:hypothetical protein
LAKALADDEVARWNGQRMGLDTPDEGMQGYQDAPYGNPGGMLVASQHYPVHNTGGGVPFVPVGAEAGTIETVAAEARSGLVANLSAAERDQVFGGHVGSLDLTQGAEAERTRRLIFNAGKK